MKTTSVSILFRIYLSPVRYCRILLVLAIISALPIIHTATADEFIDLHPGMNLFHYPVELPPGLTAFDLLHFLGDESVVSSIQRFDHATGRFQTATLPAAEGAGLDFSIDPEEGYLLYLKTALNGVQFAGERDCRNIPLKRGFNVKGLPCAPDSYRAVDVLQSFGQEAILEIKKYDRRSGTILAAYWEDGTVAGNSFDIAQGEAYFVVMNEDAVWPPPLAAAIVANPTQGGFPFEISFNATVTGGLPPYTYSWDLENDDTTDDTRASFGYVYPARGIYTVNLTVTDTWGNTAVDEVDIFVLNAPSVRAQAAPTSGELQPLEVSFSCTATDLDGDIVFYEWDFDGDGTYDWSGDNSCEAVHTYPSKGAYDAAIRVTDNDGMTGKDSIAIFVGIPPSLTASADQMSGPAPLEVNFSGTGDDPDGSVVLYEWDFDGDGTYDYSSDASADIGFTYATSGIYNATLRITDNDGITNVASIIISVAGAPVSQPRGYPLSGDVPLAVTFFCDGDDFDGSVVLFEWDFNGDGVYDWTRGYSTNVTHTYATPGTYQANLRVTDNQGLSGITPLTIEATTPNPLGYPTSHPIAAPTNGGRPLEAHLVGRGVDPNGNIVRYEWDYNGDGSYEWAEDVIPPDLLGGPTVDVDDSSSPAFCDIDADGDEDLFSGDGLGRLHFYRNDGTSTVAFWQKMGLVRDMKDDPVDVGHHSRPALADIDGDGDYDLLIGGYAGQIQWYQNEGDANSPLWNYRSALVDDNGDPVAVSHYSQPALRDIDDDGDLDLFVGEYHGKIQFYRNNGDGRIPLWTAEGALTTLWGDPLEVAGYSSPTLSDIDHDGDQDLLVGENGGQIILFKNEGDANLPIWNPEGSLQGIYGQLLDTAYYSRPFWVDIDDDGDDDLFVGEGYGKLYFYRNVGTQQDPAWKLSAERYNDVGSNYYAAPATGDIDADGDTDLVVGRDDGRIFLFQNDGDFAGPIWNPMGSLSDVQTNFIDVGDQSKPLFADIDGDGDKDLFVGTAGGEIQFFRNSGSADLAAWTPVGALTDSAATVINAGNSSSPALTDIDSDDDLDLFIGTDAGAIYFYRNSGSDTSPVWTQGGALTDSGGAVINAGSKSSPAFDDVDADGDNDLLVGTDSGEIYIYRNDGDRTAALWMPQGIFYDAGGFPIKVNGDNSPELVDIDGDGDQDLLAGDRYGQIHLYTTIGSVVHLYQTEGTYNATLRVTDSDGLTDTDSIPIVVGVNGAPSVVRIAAEPTEGIGPLDVTFTAAATDPDGSVVLYEWDFNGDGTYDWSSDTTGNTDYTYTAVGVFDAILRVTDNGGKSIRQSIAVKVNPSISASSPGGFNPHIGETGAIASSLGADAAVTLKVIDGEGNVVRTLAENEARTAGTYSDTWDGNDEQGSIVRDGVYYFIIEIVVNGEVYTYDLREDAQFTQTQPGRTFPSSFDPYSDIFFPITYSLPNPADVSIYIWTWGSDGWSVERVRTLMIRQFRGAGTHTDFWDGTDDQGTPAPSNTPYAVTLWAWELADNAMVISGARPELKDISAEPNYLSPAYNPYGSRTDEFTVISFSLTNAANVQALVYNSDGVLVRTIRKSDVPAGAGSIIWDGRDTDGFLVIDGSYRIQLTAIDSKGNRSASRYALLIVFY